MQKYRYRIWNAAGSGEAENDTQLEMQDVRCAMCDAMQDVRCDAMRGARLGRALLFVAKNGWERTLGCFWQGLAGAHFGSERNSIAAEAAEKRVFSSLARRTVAPCMPGFTQPPDRCFWMCWRFPGCVCVPFDGRVGLATGFGLAR